MKWEKNNEARKIIRNNNYLVLSTNTGKKPWINMAYYAFDNKYNLYFVSTKFSKHTKNIERNPTAAVAIFDSNQKPGTGIGIQMLAKVHKIINRAELKQAIKIYFTKRYTVPREREKHKLHKHTLEFFLGKNIYNVFKVTPTQVFINDKSSEIDRRLRVKL